MPLDAQRLSFRLWGRRPGRSWRFAFDPAEGLLLEPPNEAGAVAFRAHVQAAATAGRRALTWGVARVEDDGRIVFFGPRAGVEFLTTLASWVQARIDDIPALAALVDAGVAVDSPKLADDSAVLAAVPPADAIVRDPALWIDVLAPTPATVAHLLAPLRPGARVWAWVDPTARGEEVPVLIQSIADDPDHHRMDLLISGLVTQDDVGWSGVGKVLGDGRIELVGPDLGVAHLAAVARWVNGSVATHPGLARLAGLTLACTGDDGRIQAIIADPSLWSDIPVAPAPGTLAAAADELQALQPGEARLAWLTPAGAAEPFVALYAEVGALTRGAAERIARFPDTFEAGHSAAVARLPSGALLVSSLDDDDEGLVAALQALVARHGAAFPGLVALGVANVAPPISP